MADQHAPVALRGDEAELFRRHNAQLMRELARAVQVVAPAVIEDSCAHAWAQFLRRQPDRDRNWRGWLFRTAQHEAWRLDRQAREDRPLRTADDEHKTEFGEAVDPRDHHAIRVDVDDALSVVQELPPRLQRVAILRALGHKYNEISEITGDSPMRVGQLVARANLQIYEIIGERDGHSRARSPRAERLVQLEREQPEWLVDRIGRLPSLSRQTESHATRRRAWRRAALALDDLRGMVGAERLANVLAARRIDPELRRPVELARRAIDELHEPTHERRIGG